MKIHHVGYLVKNIEKSINSFEMLGFSIIKEPIYDEYREIDICFMKNGEYVIELVSPKTKNSVVAELKKKLGNSPYHFCYEVDDIEEAIYKLREQKFVVWQEPHEAIAIDGRKVVFLINSQIGIVELVESTRSCNIEL